MGGQTASDMDGGWKQVIDDFLEDFFLFFFPAIHSLIDFREKCQLLDKELAALVAGSATGRRHVDKLIEVHWKDGRRDLLLVHVEVQAQEDFDFAGRMFVYNSRISDRYARPVVSLALLVDDDPSFRPHEYYREVAGCELRFTFPVVKLLDYKTEDELRGDSNPFAIRVAGAVEEVAGGQECPASLQVQSGVGVGVVRAGLLGGLCIKATAVHGLHLDVAGGDWSSNIGANCSGLRRS